MIAPTVNGKNDGDHERGDNQDPGPDANAVGVRDDINGEAFGNGCGFTNPHDSTPCNNPGHFEDGKNGGGPFLSQRMSSAAEQSEGSEQVPAVAQKGCIWDGSGCFNGCDEVAMKSRCERLSHAMDSCLGDEGREKRCVWSHGANNALNALSVDLRSHGLTAYQRTNRLSGSTDFDDGDGHCEWNAVGEGAPREYEERCGSMDAAHCGAWAADSHCMWVPDGISEAVASGTRLAVECQWDGTGCASQCDQKKMTTRCATLSHDQTVCESDIGREFRCVWSGRVGGVGGEQSLVQAVGEVLSEEISSADIVLGGTLFLATAFVVFQCHRWRCSKHHEYQKLPDVAGPAVAGFV